jgi:hypothetical protein
MPAASHGGQKKNRHAESSDGGVKINWKAKPDFPGYGTGIIGYRFRAGGRCLV